MDRTKIAVALFDKLAKLYEEKFMDVGLYSDSLDLFCEQLPQKNAEILELACGPGNITKYLLSKRSDFKILGTDLAPKMLQLAKANNPTAEFGLMDCKKLDEVSARYDALMCGFCLPYLSREESEKLIRDASGILKPKGIIYISTMEDDYHKSGFKKGSTGEEIYMYYHEAAYLKKTLEENQFKIIDISRKNYSAPDGTSVCDLIILAEK